MHCQFHRFENRLENAFGENLVKGRIEVKEIAATQMSSQRSMVRPTNVIDRMTEEHARVRIWLTHNNYVQYEGFIIGRDDYLNLVVDEVVEVNIKTKNTTNLGRILLKGDNVGLVHAIGV